MPDEAITPPSTAIDTRPESAIAVPPTDPAAMRMNELVGFATELRLWDAFGRFLHFILLGDPTKTDKPGLQERCRHIFRDRMGKLTVSRSFVPDPPPWPERWPVPATPKEAVALVALKLHLGKLRDVYELLKLEPASKVETTYGKLDLGGFLIPADYERRVDTAAARLGVVCEKLRGASGWRPTYALEESLADLLDEWRQGGQRGA